MAVNDNMVFSPSGDGNVTADGNVVWKFAPKLDPLGVLISNPADTGLDVDEGFLNNFQGGLFNPGYWTEDGNFEQGGYQVGIKKDPETGLFTTINPNTATGKWATAEGGGNTASGPKPAEPAGEIGITNRQALELSYAPWLGLDPMETAGELGHNAEIIQRVLGINADAYGGTGEAWMPRVGPDGTYGPDTLEEAYDPAFVKVVQGMLQSASPSSGQGGE